MIKLQQFYVFKLQTSRIEESEYNIEQLTVEQARLNGELVAIGDNQVFRSIRRLKNIKFDKENLADLIKQRNDIKSLPSSEENSKRIRLIQQSIDSILFVPDIINVKVDEKRIYKHIFKHNFEVNGITYKRFCSGAGQSRRSTASFVNIELYDQLMEILNCGLKVDKINVAKYNAYFGLNLSATYPVSSPRFIVVDDYEDAIVSGMVDWIGDVTEKYTDKNGKEKTRISRREINPKQFDFHPNMWDGQGLISPAMAEKWQKDLDLDYLPSQFGVRSAFIKGMLVTFDFHKFAKYIAHTDTIIDHFKVPHNIKDVDCIISISQFKMHKFYDQFSMYTDAHEKYHHGWGVTKLNPKKDHSKAMLNYQYIQTLNLDKKKIQQLISPTINWIDKVCKGDKLYTLLFLLGNVKEGQDIPDLINNIPSTYIKAVLYNDKLLQDPYVKKKIYETISKKIQDAKIGRLWVDGNYQAMISDPYGQAQWIFKLPVTGLMKKDEYYSNFWNNKKVTIVDACRSPLVDFHEHNILHFVENKDIHEWYKYIESGIIYNVWGFDTIRHSDSDWDFDIVFTTNNSTMINSVYPNKNVITYEKSSAPAQRLNKNTLLTTDLRSFDSKIGQITNYSTAFISMLSNFKQGSDEHNELINRIKLLRRYIGDAIDAAKGIKMQPFPSAWKDRVSIKEDDSEKTKKEKYKHNNLVADKKPYFMIYVYDKLLNDYRSYKRKCDKTCKVNFGYSLNELLSKKYKEKTKKERKYTADYYRWMPVLKNNSVMNTLCGLIEQVDFKYKRVPNETNTSEMFQVLFDKNFQIDNEKLNKLMELQKKFEKQRYIKYKNKIMQGLEGKKETNEDQVLNLFYDEIRNEANNICSNKKELANYAIYILYYLNPTFPKEFLWDIAGEGIVEQLQEECKIIEIPQLDNNGVDYLGKKYSLNEVTL